MAHTTYDESHANTDSPGRPARFRVPLRNMEDVQLELARLYRMVKRGELSTADGKRMADILQILARVIDGGEMERRLLALEEEQKRGWMQ